MRHQVSGVSRWVPRNIQFPQGTPSGLYPRNISYLPSVGRLSRPRASRPVCPIICRSDECNMRDFCALSFERHGYLAKETVGFTKKLATCRAVAFGLEPSAEIRRWYGVISCCIQRANAKILRGEPVPGRFSAPPPRLLARGRDLALVGA